MHNSANTQLCNGLISKTMPILANPVPNIVWDRGTGVPPHIFEVKITKWHGQHEGAKTRAFVDLELNVQLEIGYLRQIDGVTMRLVLNTAR
jgi:hypothetical protein